MSPLEQKVADLEKKVALLEQGLSPAFIESLKLRLSIPKRLSDLQDVDTSGASASEVLEYNGTRWEPAVDNT